MVKAFAAGLVVDVVEEEVDVVEEVVETVVEAFEKEGVGVVVFAAVVLTTDGVAVVIRGVDVVRLFGVCDLAETEAVISAALVTVELVLGETLRFFVSFSGSGFLELALSI